MEEMAMDNLVAAEDLGAEHQDGQPAEDQRRDGPPPYLSPSGASTFRSCMRRWSFRYIDRLPDPAGEPALIGTFAHRVLELLLGLDPSERTRETAKRIAAEVWPETEADPDFVALDLDADSLRRFRWTSWQAIEGLWQLEDPSDIEVESTELVIDTELGDVPFRGVVDRTERSNDATHTLVVSDYKSGKAPSPRFRESKLDQVLLYAAAIEAEFGERPSKARLLYLGQEVIETDVDSSAIDQVVGELNDTWELMEHVVGVGFYEAQPGPLCGWCPYADKCPEGLAELEFRNFAGRINSTAPALKFLESPDEIHALATQRKKTSC